jgi:hypothetical protein
LVVSVVASRLIWRALDRHGWVALVSLLGLGVIAIFPSQIGALGSALMLALAVSFWILLITTIAAWRRSRKFPLLGAVVLLFVAIQIVPLPSHSKRDMIAGEPRFQPGAGFEEAYRAWRQRQPRGAPVIVFVAAAGGGIRASYWTSLILAQATTGASSLRHQIFLASGVSGGSLGLAIYRALLTGPHSGCGSLEDCVSAFHQHDFLAGILGATLTSGMVNPLLPVDLFPPRSQVLERTWEAAWRETVNGGIGTQHTDEFADPFEDLWRSPGPALVLNATSSSGGDRIVISNLSTDWLSNRGPCKANIAEHLRLPLSAAVNASARFPFLEGWGSFASQKDPRIAKEDADSVKQRGASPQQSPPASKNSSDPPRKPRSCEAYEAVADGGFIDNYGALTVSDALDALERTLKPNEVRPRIIVVQITSDPDCQIADALDPASGYVESCEEAAKIRREAGEALPLWDALKRQWSYTQEVWFSGKGFNYKAWQQPTGKANVREAILFSDPRNSGDPGVLGVLLNARTISGLNVFASLPCKVANLRGSYYHFSMAGAFDSPLGWSLSSTARDQLKDMLEGKAKPPNDLVSAANAENMKSLVNELKGGDRTVPKPKCK